jgi:hypothetical protein
MKFRICLFIILIFNINLYGQKFINKLSNKYEMGISYYLSPDSTDYKRELIFISKQPSDYPEYSVALETKGGIPMLKLRSFINNYSQLVWSQGIRNEEMVTSKIKSTIITVSKGFSDKLILIFHRVLKDDLASTGIKPDVYDGMTYCLLNSKYKREFQEYNFPANKSYLQLVKLMESIARDLKNGDFNEIKYIDLIDSMLKREIK